MSDADVAVLTIVVGHFAKVAQEKGAAAFFCFLGIARYALDACFIFFLAVGIDFVGED